MLHSDALQTAALGLPSGNYRQDDPDSINFEAILRFLRKRYRLYLAWLICGVLLGAGYVLVSGPSYTATAAALLQDPTPRLASDAAVAQSDTAHSTYVETQLQVFTSNEIIGRAVDALRLVDDPEFGRNAGGLRTWLIGQARLLLRPSSVAEQEPRHATIVRVKRALAVHRVGTSDVLEIQFTSRNRERSAEFATAIIRAYVDSRQAEQESSRKTAEAHDWKLLADLHDKAFPTVSPGEAITSTTTSQAQFLEEQQKTETYRALYGRLLQRALGYADSQLPSPGLQVITPATPPLIPSSRLIIVILFVGIGGVLGLGHAILREMTDDVVRVPDDLRRFEAIRRVTVIPRLHQTELRIDGLLYSHAQPSYRANCPLVYDAMGKLAVGMIETLSRRGRRVIGVVSPRTDAGTSLIAAQLSKALADTGGKVCLVDANWQLPSTDAALSGGLRYGELTGWMERTRSAAGRMDLLTLRAARPVPGLAASLSIVAALDSVGPEHQWIVVDFHAVAQMVDLEAAINLIDQVVVIIEAERTTRQELQDLLDVVSPMKLAGIVLNKVAIKRRKSRGDKAPFGGLKAIASTPPKSSTSELAVRSG